MMVLPSGEDLATKDAAICPDAPGLFSTTTVVPKTCPKGLAIVRAMMSAVPPGGYVTTNTMGLRGQVWAFKLHGHHEQRRLAKSSNAR